MEKGKEEKLEIRISRVPKKDISFKRRVDENYIIFEDEEFSNGLYPSIIVPEYHNNEKLIVIYEPDSPDNHLKKMIIIQEVKKRYLIVNKSRNYYTKSKWYIDSSPNGYYPTMICPKELVGKVVTIKKGSLKELLLR